MGAVSWYKLVVYILLSAKRRAYFCKSMPYKWEVYRDIFQKYRGQGSIWLSWPGWEWRTTDDGWRTDDGRWRHTHTNTHTHTQRHALSQTISTRLWCISGFGAGFVFPLEQTLRTAEINRMFWKRALLLSVPSPGMHQTLVQESSDACAHTCTHVRTAFSGFLACYAMSSSSMHFLPLAPKD